MSFRNKKNKDLSTQITWIFVNSKREKLQRILSNSCECSAFIFSSHHQYAFENRATRTNWNWELSTNVEQSHPVMYVASNLEPTVKQIVVTGQMKRIWAWNGKIKISIGVNLFLVPLVAFRFYMSWTTEDFARLSPFALSCSLYLEGLLVEIVKHILNNKSRLFQCSQTCSCARVSKAKTRQDNFI